MEYLQKNEYRYDSSIVKACFLVHVTDKVQSSNTLAIL